MSIVRLGDKNTNKDKISYQPVSVSPNIHNEYSSLEIEPHITIFDPSDDDLSPDFDDNVYATEDDYESENNSENDNDPDYIDSSKKSNNSAKSNNNKSAETAAAAPTQKISKSNNDYPTYNLPDLAYVCANCRSRFTSLELLEGHRQEGGDCYNQSLICKECSRSFGTRKQLSRHVDAMHRRHPVFKCDVCKCNYTNEELLMAHLPMCNGDFEDNSGILYKCKECDLKFLSKRDLFDHIAKHPVSFFYHNYANYYQLNSLFVEIVNFFYH